MALSNIEMIRLITQDNGRLPFMEEGAYILEDPEIEGYLTLCNGDVMQAARWATRSIMNWVSGISTKELTGDIEVWNDISKNYLKSAQAFLDDKSLFKALPSGIFPYAAGISVANLGASMLDPDNPNTPKWLYKQSDKVWGELCLPL